MRVILKAEVFELKKKTRGELLFNEEGLVELLGKTLIDHIINSTELTVDKVSLEVQDLSLIHI